MAEEDVVTYSKAEDLLLGDLILPKTVDRGKFVRDAAEEIDGKLGWLYKTPLAPCPPEGSPLPRPTHDDLPRPERLLLKSINNRLASGRLILTLDAAGEQTTLHAYGYSLVKEALEELHIIANGGVDLTACRADSGDVAGQDDQAASIVNEDDESLLLGFQNTVLKGVPFWTQPGKVYPDV